MIVCDPCQVFQIEQFATYLTVIRRNTDLTYQITETCAERKITPCNNQRPRRFEAVQIWIAEGLSDVLKSSW